MADLLAGYLPGVAYDEMMDQHGQVRPTATMVQLPHKITKFRDAS